MTASDRRGLFTFNERNLASGGMTNVLALAARSSASFPAAFEPSFLPYDEPASGVDGATRPAMKAYANFNGPHWAADGGLLDNYPIDDLLQTIFDARADRHVRRVLMYVVPSAKSPAQPPDDITRPFGLVEGVLKEVSAIKAQSITNDLRAIVQHNDRVRAHRDARTQLAALATPKSRRLTPAKSRLLTPEFLELYGKKQASGQSVNAQLPIGPEDFVDYGRGAYDRAKVIVLDLIRAGYGLAQTLPDVQSLAKLTKATHGSLGLTSVVGVTAAAWEDLSKVLNDGARDLLRRLADAQPKSPKSQTINKLLEYLAPAGSTDGPSIVMRLFDLAIAQRSLAATSTEVDQLVEFVQVTADTTCAIDPGRNTAASKLTGEQLHHFGAFYKPSWRANDWMWGRLDGAGWLIRILLDPRRIRLLTSAAPRNSLRSQWFFDQLQQIVEPSDEDASRDSVQRTDALSELRFLDSDSAELPPQLDKTALWVASAFQINIAAEEMRSVAEAIGQTAQASTSELAPTRSSAWARSVFTAVGRAAFDDAAVRSLLTNCPVSLETLRTEAGSPLFRRTASKAVATAAGALDSVQQIPGVIRGPILAVRTVTLDAYKLVSVVGARTRFLIIFGLVLVGGGLALAIQGADVLGLTGGLAVAVGALLLVFGAWGTSRRVVPAAAAMFGLLVLGSLGIPAEQRWLFGTGKPSHVGLVGKHVEAWIGWLGRRWIHPMIVAVIAVALIAICVVIVAKVVQERERTRLTR